MNSFPFHLKVRIGEMEIEISGNKDEVFQTLDDLDKIVDKVTTAFHPDSHKTRPKKMEQETEETQVFPQIPRTTQCSEAVSALLISDWGKIPRSIAELREAMEANAVFFPRTTLSGVLVWLVKKGSIRRAKDKKRGYLYTMNSVEAR
jgi:hypothetical protein